MSIATAYTVIIPTRERAETLRHTLRTVVEQDYDNLDIIVSDNFSQDNTREVVESFSDRRIRYFNTGKRLSMSDNFEFALQQAHDSYIMFLGDDDGILPDAIRRVNAIVETTGVQAVASGRAAYCWPNHPDGWQKNKMSWSAGNRVEIRNSSEWIRKILSFRPIYTFDLPGLYLGFVHSDVIASMKKNGVFFQSQTPDAYSAFASVLGVDRYAFARRPFAIHGSSARSNGASQLGGGDKSESEKFIQENTIPFHPMLQWCPSFSVIMAETFLRLRDAFPEKTAPFEFDFRKLCVAALCEGNEATRAAIDRTVLALASQQGINLSALATRRKLLTFKVERFLFEMKKQFPLSEKYLKIPDATKIGVWNIYDAAKAMEIFLGINERSVPTRYSQYVNRVLRFIKGT